MRIHGLLGQLPCEPVSGLRNLKELAGGKKTPADIDTGTLIFVCALTHKEAYNARQYKPSLAEFQRLLIVFQRIHKWEFTCIFDGCPPPEKQHKHKRRSEKEDPIVITSEFISICVEFFWSCFIPYIVSPAEADMQVGRRNELAIPVCRDSDSIGYGN